MDFSTTRLSDYTGPLAAFPLERTGPENAYYRGWWERRVVPDDRVFRVEYEISGTNYDPAFPYVSGVPSLKEAITIARLYPGIYPDGSATHVLRRVTRRDIEVDPSRKWTGQTHRWRVFPDWAIELLFAFARYGESQSNGLRRVGIDQWLGQLPPPPSFRRDRALDNGKPLAAELSDLVYVASRFGYTKAANALRPLVAELSREALHTAPPPNDPMSAIATPAARDDRAPQRRRGLMAIAARLIRVLTS